LSGCSDCRFTSRAPCACQRCADGSAGDLPHRYAAACWPGEPFAAGPTVQPCARSAGLSLAAQCPHRYSWPPPAARYAARTAGPHRSHVSVIIWPLGVMGRELPSPSHPRGCGIWVVSELLSHPGGTAARTKAVHCGQNGAGDHVRGRSVGWLQCGSEQRFARRVAGWQLCRVSSGPAAHVASSLSVAWPRPGSSPRLRADRPVRFPASVWPG